MMSTLFSLKHRFVKRIFDPANAEDLAAYKKYVQTNNWGPDGCPFELEWPWLDIPSMLSHKISQHFVEQI